MHDAAATMNEIVGEHRLRVRYGECDQMGVVYHPNYLVWFHEARDALMSALDIDIAAIERLGYRFPVSDVSCRYLHSARVADNVLIITRVKPEPVARMHFHFEALLESSRRLLARGETLVVITDSSGRLLLRPPQDLKQLVSGTALYPKPENAQGRP